MPHKILICPYCGDEKSDDELGCCGESRDNFEYIYPEDDDKSDAEIYAEENPR